MTDLSQLRQRAACLEQELQRARDAKARRIKEEAEARMARDRAEWERKIAREQAEINRVRALRAAENYSRDPRKTDGLFQRYRTATAEHREIIDDHLEQLMPRFTGPEDERRPHPAYARLSYDAKLVTLGAFLGICVARDEFPRLRMNAADWAADAYVFEHRGPADLDLWRQALPTIRDHLEAGVDHKAEYTVEPFYDASHVMLRRHPALPERLELADDWHRPGYLFLGLDVVDRGNGVYIPFERLEHILLAGATGYGKSNALGLLVRNYVQDIDKCHSLILVDGKMGIAFRRWRGKHPKIEVIETVEDFAAMLERLVKLIDQRNRDLADTGLDNASDYIPVLIDEIATFTRKPDGGTDVAKRHAAMMKNLFYVCEKGRSAGVRIVVSTQAVNDDGVPVLVRNAATTKIAFRLEIPSHVTGLFGGTDGLPGDLGRFRKGQAVVRTSDQQWHAQFPLIPPPASTVTTPAAITPAPTPTVSPAPANAHVPGPMPLFPNSAMPVCQLHHRTVQSRTSAKREPS